MMVQGTPRKPRKPSRQYSGCGTCRARKIRCDRRQPSCFNCERSRRYMCDGYTNSTPAADAGGDSSSQSKTYVTGLPNTTVQGLTLGEAVPEIDNAIEEVASGEPITFSYDESLWTWEEPSAFGQTVDSSDEACTNLLVFQSEIEVQDFSNVFPPPPSVFCSGFDQPGQSLVRWSPQPTSALIPEPLSSTMGLLGHWQARAAHLMMPITSPSNNPWLRLYVPTALELPLSSAKQSLFHAILAAAAYHQANFSQQDKGKYLDQAAQHKQQAGNILMSLVGGLGSLSWKTIDPADRKALLAAAMTMSSIEVFSGEYAGAGYKHLHLGRRIVRLTGGTKTWLADGDSETLLQIFRCLQVIGNTSGWSNSTQIGPEDDEPCIHKENSALEMSPVPSRYSLDTTFGISMPTMKYLSRIIEISDAKVRYPSHELWYQDHAEDIAKLEVQILDIIANAESFSDSASETRILGIEDYVAQEIKENHMWAFHYSTAIFYYRSLFKTGHSNGSPTGAATMAMHAAPCRRPGQNFVAKALEHLENIDALSNEALSANTLWVAFIAAVEAFDMQLRHRAIAWFGRAKRHRIGNIAKAKAFVQEVWRRVDQSMWSRSQDPDIGLSNVDWRVVMNEKGMYIMLT